MKVSLVIHCVDYISLYCNELPNKKNGQEGHKGEEKRRGACWFILAQIREFIFPLI